MAQQIKKSLPWFVILALVSLTAGFNFYFETSEMKAATITPTVTVGNTAPTVSNVDLTPNPIILNENTTLNATCTASSSDQNGGGDVSTGTAVFYRSGAASSTANDNYCYIVASCTLGTPSGNNRDITCTTSLWFIAEATDASSSYSAETWQCQVKVIDSQNASSTATDSTPPELGTRYALIITSSIGYGTLSPGASSTVASTTTATTTGNSAIDVNLYGVDMATTSYTIPVGNQEYSSSTFTYGNGIDLSVTPGASYNLDLSKPTSHPSTSTDDIYWKIYIPVGQQPGTYYGTNTASAIGAI